MNVSGTRRTHDLSIHQANGESYPLTRGHLQGVITRDSQDRPWFTSSGYFDAWTLYQPSVEWWLYDATTDQASPSNSSNLVGWLDNTDTDGVSDLMEVNARTNPNGSAPIITVSYPTSAFVF